MMETSTLTEDDNGKYPVGDAYPPAVKFEYAQPGLRVPNTSQPFVPSLTITRPVLSGDLAPTPKTGYAANYGVYKMNWYMISRTPKGAELLRIARKQNPEGSDDEVSLAAGLQLNKKDGYEGRQLATEIIMQAWNMWGHDAPDEANLETSAFWAGHRWGGGGLLDKTYSHYPDVLAYYKGVERIKRCCDADPNVWRNSKHCWAEVVAI
jgi:hypothetical protein